MKDGCDRALGGMGMSVVLQWDPLFYCVMGGLTDIGVKGGVHVEAHTPPGVNEVSACRM